MKVLITGITGFVGSHLADYILAKHPDVEIYGTQRWRSPKENIKHLEGEDRINLIELDLIDAKSCYTALRDIRPDRIFHLAAQSFVPSSWNAPTETITTNVIGNVNLFEAMCELDLMDTRIQIACSSEEYGFVSPDECPIKEENPLRPLSPYGVSKVSQDMLGYQYFKSYGIHAIRTRGFNHTGPRRGDVFICSNFALQVANIEKGNTPPVMKVGNLEAIRDFTDVRDMVHAYWLALEKGEKGEVYNITTANAIKIQYVLDKLVEYANVDISVEEDPARLRPSDVPRLIGDYSKFKAATGWEPTIPFDQTLLDILDYWRERV